MKMDDIISKTLIVEGGYVNDPDDSGGETNWGVTVVTARANGYEGSMRDMTRADAIDIYRSCYWSVNNLDDVLVLSPPVTEKLFDIAVNMGNYRAGEFLQRILNVLNNGGAYYPDLRTDGQIGARTVAALRSYLDKRGDKGAEVLVTLLTALQGAFYVTLAERRQKDERFMYGWASNRL